MIAAVRDIGQRVGVAVEAYDFSEPQSGKDVCDRTLCPLKSSVGTYCSEGNDILSASDMRDALQKHPVRATSASVNMVDESKKSLQVKKIDHLSGFHNFTFESSGIRARRAYKIGRGKLFPYDTLYLKHQEATGLMTKDADKTFFKPIKERRLKTKKPKDVQLPSGTNAEKDTALFECVFPGCTQVFEFFSDLEQHLDVRKHTSNQETMKNTEKTNRLTSFQKTPNANPFLSIRVFFCICCVINTFFKCFERLFFGLSIWWRFVRFEY